MPIHLIATYMAIFFSGLTIGMGIIMVILIFPMNRIMNLIEYQHPPWKPEGFR